MTARAITLFIAILTAGLSAGLFFGWAVSVIPGTRRISDRTYIETMQRINVAIVNPLFLLVFLGAAISLGVTAIVHFGDGYDRRGWWLVAATATYVVGVLGVTVGGNIPLNNALDRFDLDGADDASVAAERAGYEIPWNRWHNLRTAAAVAAVSLAVVAALTTADIG